MKQEFPEIVHGEVTRIERDWHRVFAIIPRRTVSDHLVWMRWAYRQKVCVYSGFAEEPEYRYAELFDLMR